MADWNAKVYERISEPQFAWGKRVLERLELDGDETVIDAGCGAGRLTELLLERLPRGRVVAVDASGAMLEAARARLGRWADRVDFVQADLATYVRAPAADAVFSTATFHWVLDHDALFASIHASLAPAGQLVAQCGAAGNLGRFRARTHELRARPDLAPLFAGFCEPWNYASAEDTVVRLERTGFARPRVWTEAAPAVFEDASSFREFAAHVVLRDELARLPDEVTRAAYLDALTEAAASDDPPYTLDYVRLNLDARRA